MMRDAHEFKIGDDVQVTNVYPHNGAIGQITGRDNNLWVIHLYNRSFDLSDHKALAFDDNLTLIRDGGAR